MNIEQSYTIRETATALRVSPSTLYRMINSGDISAYRAGKNQRILESEILRIQHPELEAA